MFINCSGVFRDLFINQMNLLDQAVKMAAEADEPVSMNYVRKHAYSRRRKWALTSGKRRPCFSNASGSYSSNINLAVENSTWESESELQEMYLSTNPLPSPRITQARSERF